MNENRGFRSWYYFRMGWGTYFAFIFAAINTLVVTYYLAIERVPALLTIFPNFLYYVLIISSIGVPLLIIVGYIHYKRSAAFSAEADINVEAYPYWYKLPPGWNKEVVFPLYLQMINLMIKISKNEKLSTDETKEMSDIQKSLSTLIEGGYIGKPARMKGD